MKFFWQIVYNTAGLGLLYIGLCIGFLLNEKIRRGIKGRKGLWVKLKTKLTPGKWVWFHVSSMGEFEQAKPIISRLKEKRKELKILVTFFSPSGYEPTVNSYKEAEIISYLPFDTPWQTKKILKLITPVLLIFIKYDLWPNLVWQAKKMKIPILLADGSLSHTKLNFLAKLFYKHIYSELTTICAILKEDEDIFKTLVSSQTKILVTGDTRYDQVYRRLEQIKKEGFRGKEFFNTQARIIVAGSTWLNDEKVMLPAYKSLINKFEDLILVLIPHEPKNERLVQIEKMLSQLNISFIRWSNLEKIGTIKDIKLVIVDKIGILANLYYLAELTYVGGSFGHGVHNCLEPAVMGKPVFFGPKIQNSKEARLLVERGAGFVITNSYEMITKMTQLLSDQELLTKCNMKAFELVKENLGATEKIINEIEEIYPITS